MCGLTKTSIWIESHQQLGFKQQTWGFGYWTFFHTQEPYIFPIERLWTRRFVDAFYPMVSRLPSALSVLAFPWCQGHLIGAWATSIGKSQLGINTWSVPSKEWMFSFQLQCRIWGSSNPSLSDFSCAHCQAACATTASPAIEESCDAANIPQGMAHASLK